MPLPERPTGGANTGVTAAAVVVILIILIVSIVIATVVFVFLVSKKHKSPKQDYSIGNPEVVQDGISEFIIHLVKMCVLTNLLIRYVHVFFVAL